MTTIITRYVGPTNRRGARIIADAGMKRRVSVSFDYAARNPHQVAALALCAKFDWKGTLVEGGMEHGRAYVFLDDDAIVNIPEANTMPCTECGSVQCPHATDDDARCIADPR